MEETKPTSATAATEPSAARRRQTEPKRPTARGRAKADVNSLRLQALTALTTLGENDRFMLVVEKQGSTSTVVCWH
jgi:hypothetical protein